MFKYFCIYTLITLSHLAFSQKTYFDRFGKSTTQNQAYCFREKMGNEDYYKSFYNNTEILYFEGKILQASSTDENQNVYQGVCKWYHKNTKLKSERNFNDQGQEEGKSIYYFESGKVWKELC